MVTIVPAPSTQASYPTLTHFSTLWDGPAAVENAGKETFLTWRPRPWDRGCVSTLGQPRRGGQRARVVSSQSAQSASGLSLEITTEKGETPTPGERGYKCGTLARSPSFAAGMSTHLPTADCRHALCWSKVTASAHLHVTTTHRLRGRPGAGRKRVIKQCPSWYCRRTDGRLVAGQDSQVTRLNVHTQSFSAAGDVDMGKQWQA